MSSFETLSHQLTESLQLASAPVAVCFADAAPAHIPAWQTKSPAGCQFWGEGASKAFVTSPADHELCAIGTYTHNMKTSAGHESERGNALAVFAQLGYVREQDLPLIPVLSQSPKHVVYSPLAQAPATPDVVLLFVRPDQTLILTEAMQQVEGQWMPALGRPACAIVPQAVNTQKAALSLGCCGARAYVDALKQDVQLYAIPGSKLEVYTERIVALTQANAVLTKFHTLRRQDVEAGKSPTIQESLARLQG